MALKLSVEHQTKVDLRTIIEQNLDLMLSQEGVGMTNCINSESWGGNAGVDENGHSQVAANFLYNPHNGKIRLFGNFGDRAKGWDELYQAGYYLEGTFILTHSRIRPLQIIEILKANELPEEARTNILRSIGLYNKRKKELFS